jgi:hypothetical protein
MLLLFPDGDPSGSRLDYRTEVEIVATALVNSVELFGNASIIRLHQLARFDFCSS